eukprot:2918917-Amphidinium_carterae.1
MELHRTSRGRWLQPQQSQAASIQNGARILGELDPYQSHAPCFKQQSVLPIATRLQAETAITQDLSQLVSEVKLTASWTESLAFNTATLRSPAGPPKQFNKGYTRSWSSRTAGVPNGSHSLRRIKTVLLSGETPTCHNSAGLGLRKMLTSDVGHLRDKVPFSIALIAWYEHGDAAESRPRSVQG